MIDGRLDDAAWRDAGRDERFVQNFPDEGRAPSQRTELYLVYDDHALYIGVRCHDREPALIVERLTRRDRDTDADKVTVDIDSRRDHESAYHFDLNVSGVLADGVRFNDTDFNGDWDGLWDGAATRDAGGWSAEIEIPWRTLRFTGSDPVMGLQVRRYLQRRQEIDEWAYIPRTARAEVSRYGALAGLHGLTPTRLLQIAPYVAARVTRIGNSGLQDGVDLQPQAGVDLKLGVTNSLILDATVNPDFGQVEADQVQLNLTTFEIFYPEKRPFFLEGVDLFATPIQQFYTRRVGHAPPAPVLADGDLTVEAPTQGRIWGAAKLSGQVVPHLSVAALEAITAEQTGSVLPSGGSAPVKQLLEPLANYAVLRVRSDFLGQSYAGVTATAVDRVERGTFGLCPNDLTPNGDYLTAAGGRCTHDAYTVGGDLRLVTRDGTWGAVAHAVVSAIAHGPTRPIADGTRIGDGDDGFGINVQAGKQGGDHVLFGCNYTGYSPKLDLNDAGYLRQQNLHQTACSFTLRSTKPIGPTLETSWETYVFNKFSWAGDRLFHEAGTGLWSRWRNFWQSWIGVQYHLPFYDNRETRDGALTERPGGPSADVWLKTDPRARFLVELNGHFYTVLRGASIWGDVRFALRPLPQIELDVIPRANYTWGDPRWAYVTDTLGDGSRRYWFGDLTSQSFDVTVRGTYTFTPRLTLQLYAQVFVAGYHFEDFAIASGTGDRPTLAMNSFTRVVNGLGLDEDFREGAINVNVVLRWEYLPGSTLIGVYTRAQVQPDYLTSEGPGAPSLRPFRGAPTTDVFLLKLNYLWN